MIILSCDCFRWTARAISPAVCGADWPGLRPGMRTFWLQEGQVTSCPGVVPGMKKFQPQLQFSESLAMGCSLSLEYRLLGSILPHRWTIWGPDSSRKTT